MVAQSADVLAHGPDEPLALLSAAERGRWGALRRPVDRDDFVAARVLVRRLVIAAHGSQLPLSAISLSQRCSRCGGPHGRPVLRGPCGDHVSWAHASGTVAVVVSDRPVGIDLERSDAVVPEIDGRVRTVGEWVRLEALVKASGVQLDEALADRLPAGFEFVDWAEEGPAVVGAVAFGSEP